MKKKAVQLPAVEDRFAPLDARDLNELERESIVNLALQVLALRCRRGASLSAPGEVRQYLQLQYAEKPNEIFGVLLLDNRHQVIALEELFQGTIDGASVHPRVVVQRALARNAAAVILVHNHPSGVAEPSQADRSLTRRLQDALALVEIRVLDHFVVGWQETVSFAERGWL